MPELVGRRKMVGVDSGKRDQIMETNIDIRKKNFEELFFSRFK